MDMLNYLLLVNIYLVLFYVFYAIFLKDETFFKLNRIYLVGGASLSFLIPFLQSEWIRSLFVTKRVEEVTQNISLTFSNEAMIIPVKEQAFETGEIILFIYLAGTVLGLLRFFWQLYKVRSVFKSEETDHAFSFFHKVKVGKSVPNRDTVYDHELVHARQWHSADVILFEIISIINWFNPVVYLYRIAIKHIHEFTADEIASSREESRSAYALILLSKTFGIPTHQLTNSFYNQSLLKRRIIMLHKSKSTRNALLKYGLSAPLFAAMMILSSASFKPENVAEQLSDVSSEAMELIQTETDYESFLNRNSTVQRLEWRTFTHVFVFLKSGKKESYELSKPSDLRKAEGLYGQFPSPPPPPPPVMDAKANVVSSEDVQGAHFSNVDQMPEFPGGMKAFYDYFSKNFKYPDAAKKENIGGKMIMNFVVEADGQLSAIKVLRSLGRELDEEAIRVLSASPNWKPGIKSGSPVRVEYTLPVAVSPPGQKTGAVSNNKGDERVTITDIPKNSIFILDGKEVSQNIVDEVDTRSIKLMNVFTGEQAASKYGERGRNGAVEIYVKNSPQNLTVAESRIVFPGSTHLRTTASRTTGGSGNNNGASKGGTSATYYATDSITVSDGEITLQGTGSKIEVDNYTGLIFLNGIEKNDKSLLKTLEPNTIESIRVLNRKSAVERYGNRGKEGAIEITLKKK